MTCMRSMTNGCHGGSTADGRNRKSPAPPSSASAATSTRPPPCASIGVYSYTPILAGDAPPPLLHEQVVQRLARSEEHTSELQSLMRISYAVFCLKKKKKHQKTITHQYQ